MKLKVDEDFNTQKLLYDKHIELRKRILEGIPAFYSMGYVNQLPPVGMKSIAKDSNSDSSCSSGAIMMGFLNSWVHLLSLKLLIFHFI